MLFQWIVGILLLLSSIGVLLFKRPVHASLSFLLSLLSLATLYVNLSAQFIAVLQVLVYAGAILVIFMFVIVLFQDAHEQLSLKKPQSNHWLIAFAVVFMLFSFLFLEKKLRGLRTSFHDLPAEFGSVQEIGKELYLNYFFPFEAVTLLFLVAVVGAIYTAKKGV